MFDQQLTIDGGAEDLAPAHRQEKLFQPVRVMEGQTSLTFDRAERLVRTLVGDAWYPKEGGQDGK